MRQWQRAMLAVLLAAVPVVVFSEPTATVTFSALPAGGGFELSNGLVRSRWRPYSPAAGADRTDAEAPLALNQTYEIHSSSGWATLGDTGLGLQVSQKALSDNASWSLRQKLAIPGLDEGRTARKRRCS